MTFCEIHGRLFSPPIARRVGFGLPPFHLVLWAAYDCDSLQQFVCVLGGHHKELSVFRYPKIRVQVVNELVELFVLQLAGSLIGGKYLIFIGKRRGAQLPSPFFHIGGIAYLHHILQAGICHNIDIALRHRAPPLTFSYIISNFPTFSIAHYNGNPHICPAPGPAGLVFSPQIW